MDSSWQISIDDEHETALVTSSIFRFSRNPIFLGMRLNLLGLFLIMPNALTLAFWLLGDVASQSGAEEKRQSAASCTSPLRRGLSCK